MHTDYSQRRRCSIFEALVSVTGMEITVQSRLGGVGYGGHISDGRFLFTALAKPRGRRGGLSDAVVGQRDCRLENLWWWWCCWYWCPFLGSSLRDHLRVVGMLRLVSFDRNHRACLPTPFYSALGVCFCLFDPFNCILLHNSPPNSPLSHSVFCLFFWSYMSFISHFSCISLFESLPNYFPRGLTFMWWKCYPGDWLVCRLNNCEIDKSLFSALI